METYITLFDFPLPSTADILEIINDFAKELDINIEKDVVSDLAVSFKGLNDYFLSRKTRRITSYLEDSNDYFIMSVTYGRRAK